MTSQLRYRTLVDNLARIYDATDETRTGRLQEGLTKVLETIDPKSADGWQHVKVDSMRLLRVWRAREDCQGDSTLADQILEALTDFATDDVPHLEITERPCAAAVTVTPPSETRTAAVATVPAVPVVVEKPMTPAEIRAIEAALDAAEEEEDEAEAIEAALAGEEDAETEEEEEEEVEVDEEAVALPAPVPAAAVVEAASETTEEEEVEVEEEETPEEIVEPEADSEAEADEEEEEEEGVEVEKRTIRGREYWLSSDGTLYAVADDDEIGEEVGRINKDGRPVFLAPK